MSRLEVNRSGELEVFSRVVELGGFSAAARAYGLTPSAVSKLVSRLEQRLGARLLVRSTRGLQLTPEGCAFYERGLRVLAELDEAERSVSDRSAPRGRVRVNANVPFGHHWLLPLVPAFLRQYPGVTLDIALTDAVVNLVEQRTDIAVRAGPLKSSSLLARKLGDARMLIVGAPAYLEQRGRPATPHELRHHNLIGPNYPRAEAGWRLRHAGDEVVVPVSGNAQASDGESIRRLALAGLGLARLAHFQVHEDIAAGRLEPLLPDCSAHDTEEVHAVFMGPGTHLPLRVRVFLDFLVAQVRLNG